VDLDRVIGFVVGVIEPVGCVADLVDEEGKIVD